MLEITWLTLLIVSAAAASLICARIAHDKRRSSVAWFFIGLIFNLPAVVVLVRLKALEPGANNECK